MNKKVMAEKQDNNCIVCCRELTIFAIGECDHAVCYICATRLRVLSKRFDCAICRKELPKMILCNQKQSYRELKDLHFALKDSKHKLHFQDIDIQKAYYKLLEHRCKFCDSRPTYASFHSLKDHVRKEHEKHFCDLCVEHLMIFTFEKKCYSRADLARHRRVGDEDDTSHRGHPLCEFCDTRFLDEDELYKHLRREHFYCHFCDADGFHHYYNDYEYLRQHFRHEHFLCEEGDCLHEKFTTVFRSEIDLKAHRATIHNKNLSKSEMKQARTLELEFSIAPRNVHPPRGNASSRGNRDDDHNFNGENTDHRPGRRFRRGENRDDYRNKRHTDDTDFASAKQVPPSSLNIDMNDSQAFPSLNNLPSKGAVGTDQTQASSGASDTMAQKLAKINRFSVGKRSANNEEEFPALAPSANGKSKINSRLPSTSSATSWGGSTSASVSLSSSAAPPGSNFTKNTLTFKLNSKDEFPGLNKNGKPVVTPSSVSFHMTHNVKSLPQNINSDNQSNHPSVKKSEQFSSALNSNSGDYSKKNNPPVVTRLTSTQNITFINTPTSQNAAAKVEDTDSSNGRSRTETGWYVLKKGKTTKTEEPVAPAVAMNVSSKEDFPELEKGKLKMRFKESANAVSNSSAWRSTESTNDSGIDEQVSKSAGKKKKKKDLNTAAAQSGTSSSEAGKKKKKSNISSIEKLKKLIETHAQNLLPNDVEENDKVSDGPDEIRKVPVFNSEDWPAVNEAEIPGTIPPPGFEGVGKNTINPPPGFSTSVSKAPPGFQMAQEALANGHSKTLVTFTNSSGEDFSFSSNDENGKYIQLPEFSERNKRLMDEIVNLLGGKNEKFVNFVETSGKFRRSEILALDYYEFCVKMMGKGRFEEIFSELLVLLPDINKQQELLCVHREFNRKSTNKNENFALTVCNNCQQVLCKTDLHFHERQHVIYK